MQLTSSELPGGIRKIDLDGRLDVEGSDSIAMKFTILTSSTQTFSIIDLSNVEFLASIGIATLVRNAKAARQRAGNMVLLNPRPNVAAVLTATAIDKIIPVCFTLDEACAQVKPAESVG